MNLIDLLELIISSIYSFIDYSILILNIFYFLISLIPQKALILVLHLFSFGVSMLFVFELVASVSAFRKNCLAVLFGKEYRNLGCYVLNMAWHLYARYKYHRHCAQLIRYYLSALTGQGANPH